MAQSKEDSSSLAPRFSGACDASAAVAVDDVSILMADDENNTLRLYRSDRPGPPVASFPWDAHLGIDPRTDKHPEVDIEGAAILGGHVYWISSHGRNKDGKWRANRHRFFALSIVPDGEGIRLEPFGKPTDGLAASLAANPRLRGYGLDEALQPGRDEVKRLAPKREGFNIEGLSAMPDGRSLLVAFRNPRPGGRALLVPLTNPAAVVAEGAAPAWGEPIELDLASAAAGKTRPLGIRGIEYSDRVNAYFLIAGPHDEEKTFAVYRWSGGATDRPELLPADTAAVNGEPGFTPEALVLFANSEKMLVLGDDGSRRVKVASPAECRKGAFDRGECEAKDLLDPARKTFRGLWLLGK
ncbi:MAG: hypothetical protein JW809_13405 [Pirellulales bacterium]|nr:hypothetical protein [Pirellulales bacterium]